MKLKLVRFALEKEYTIGKLYVNDIYECDVLEDTVRDFNKDGDLDEKGEEKIYGKTAIPYGVYTIDLTYSNRFKKVLPLLENVKGFDGIRIHSGNVAEDTHGCLLVGTNAIKGQIINSKKTFDKLMIKLTDAHSMKETIIIEIV